MLSRNGGRLASNCLRNRNGTVAARGFFDVFWRWSTVGCQAPSRVLTASLRTRATRQRPARRTYLPPTEYTSTPASPDEDDLPTTIRLLMRTLPHSVVVVTSSQAPFSPNESTPQSYRGMTVSSFTTITLSPQPIISFNVKTPSETLTAIQESNNFLLHILEANESGARLADAFTKGSEYAARLLEGGEEGVEILRMVQPAEEGEDEEAAILLPRLEAKGVSRVLGCQVVEQVEVGDHVVVFAAVDSVFGGEMSQEDGELGLCYADGRYRRVGGIIDVDEDGGIEEGDSLEEAERREVMRKIG